MDLHEAYKLVEEAKKKLAREISSDNHPQFIYNRINDKVECRCGHAAVWWKTGFVCGTITAYSCKYNKIEE